MIFITNALCFCIYDGHMQIDKEEAETALLIMPPPGRETTDTLVFGVFNWLVVTRDLNTAY